MQHHQLVSLYLLVAIHLAGYYSTLAISKYRRKNASSIGKYFFYVIIARFQIVDGRESRTEASSWARLYPLHLSVFYPTLEATVMCRPVVVSAILTSSLRVRSYRISVGVSEWTWSEAVTSIAPVSLTAGGADLVPGVVSVHKLIFIAFQYTN